MLNTEQLLNLEDIVLDNINENITGILTKLNRTNKLDDFLNLIGLSNLISKSSSFSPYKTGKIVVIGDSKPDTNVLLAIAEHFGINKTRFELCLDYDLASTFNYKKMQYNPDYSLVLFGAVPHSAHEKGNYNSIITAIENKDGYPPVLRVGEEKLKITKSSFKKALENALDLGYIV